MENTNTIPNTKKQSVINRSAVKAFALKVSKERRANKFTRVSEEFLVGVEADVESAIRAVESNSQVNSVCASEVEGIFVTGHALMRIKEKLNLRARQIVESRVMRHPSLGVTLKD